MCPELFLLYANKMSCYVFCISLLFFVFNVRGCERSLEVRGVEDYCWTRNVEVIDRLQYTGKSILNFAKKKLGMDVEMDGESQKCDYYKCIFQELKLLNDGYPSEQQITTWIKNNVIYNHAMNLLSRVDICSAELSSRIGSNTFFSVEMMGEAPKNDENGEPMKIQGKCDIVAEYMKCMSMVEQNDCPVFQYP